MIYFHYYTSHVNSYKPIGTISLEEFVESIKSPSEKILRVFRLIATAGAYAKEAENPEVEKRFLKRKDDLKQNNLFYFTPCVYTDGLGRRYANIRQFNGLAVLDFDKIDEAEKLKHFIFENYKCVICAYLSPSKKGVKFLVKIPIVQTPDEFKEYFFGLGTEFQKVKGWDGTAQNSVLPLFLSYDPDILYRRDAETWTKKGKVLNAFVASSGPVVKIETTDEQKARVYYKIRKAFEVITSEGHPQVRSAAIALGGYVATGYLTAHEAEALIEECVRSTPYLQKGISGYTRTGRSAIAEGQKNQLFLD